jgi:hypothetical protein
MLARQRAVKRLMVEPYRGKLKLAFKKWAVITDYKRFLYKNLARLMTIRVSKAKLKVALDRWAYKKQKKAIHI